MSNNKKIRNWLIAIVAVAVIVPLILRVISPAGASASTVNAEEKVVALEVAQTIEASGSLEAQPSATLTWNTGGVVEEVYVQVGDKVSAGDVLMKLRTTTVSSGVISAQADLVTAQQGLDDLLSSSDTELAQAVIDLKDSKEEYDKAVNYLEYLQRSKKVPQTQTKVFIQSKRNSWQYVYKTKTFKGPAPEDWIVEAENDFALKKGQYEDAQRAYDLLKDGPNAQDVLAAQARVDAAQATVDSMSVIAPFDGEVLYVESQPRDVVSVGTSALNVADLDHLYVKTQVDEVDVASARIGQPAEITLDALPGVTFTGEVAAINPVGELISGLVKYVVRIDLDQVDDRSFLPLGTTANIVINVSEATTSLAVPITTIQNDANGEFVMVMQNDGTAKRVNVISGAIVDELVVVSGDLQEGERVLVNNASSFNAPNPFSGGGE